MNFLIISLARCGSSSLQKSIAKKYNLNIIFEPYAIWNKMDYKMENVVVKTLFHQIDNKHHTTNSNEIHFDNCINFYVDLIPKFDKVILLNRLDLQKQAESLIGLYEGNPYDGEYIYNPKLNTNGILEKLKLENFYLKKLSNIVNIPMDSYESIYYGNGLNDKNISLEYSFIDIKNKLRKEPINKSML